MIKILSDNFLLKNLLGINVAMNEYDRTIEYYFYSELEWIFLTVLTNETNIFVVKFFVENFK